MIRLFSIAALALAPTVLLASGPAAVAQEITAVQTFVRVCYSQVPRLQGIRNMATQLGWVPLSGEALLPYADDTDADIVEAWDVELDGRSYRLGLVQGPLTASMKEDFPTLSEARFTTCTLTLDDVEPNDAVAAEMHELAK